MKTNSLLILFLITVPVIIISCNNTLEKKDFKGKTKSSNIENLIDENETRLIQKNNVYEVSQKFLKKNQASDIIGKIEKIDLTKSSGAMISAYSNDKGDYSIFFRTFEKNNWSNWTKLEENKEVQNPNRIVFSPKNLNSFVTKIQFKSSQIVEEEVIFRIYTFKKL
jgi:hypothetical protein